MKIGSRIPTDKLRSEPYASILCYPKVSGEELEKRLVELKGHDVKALEFIGKANAFNLPVLGKGYVGIVVKAHLTQKSVALKIRRLDADRPSLQHEAQMLFRANAIKVGPKLIGVSRNFLLTQLIEGHALPEWLKVNKEKHIIQSILIDLLEQCWRLDNNGLDHGELSKAPKHIIINKQQKPFIVDFETASINRRPANVTSICQFLFLSGSHVSKMISEITGEKNFSEIISTLKLYKRNRTRKNFTRLLSICLS